MDDVDDFGDLYGDLDYHGSYKKEREKSESKAVEVNSVKEESESIKEATKLAEEDTDNSDSDDDDFRIVLNEDDRPKFQHSRGGGTAGIDEVEESDNAGDHLNNERRCNQAPATVADESVQGSALRGGGMNGGQCHSRHAGSHLGGFPGSMRSSVPGRSVWDKPSTPCSAPGQAGVTFCLPRYRTIFDINIEAFEQKPWRHHGSDVTEYFNFGLDEESWKSYCQALDNCRQQAMMSHRFPVCQSSRLNQGGRNHSPLESTDRGGRGFDMPKGRAIQVEDSLGERIPSTDIRRPRVLDSDVVIQINMEGSVEEASAFCKEGLDQADEHIDASLSTSGNNSSERVPSPQHGGSICRSIANSVEHYSSELDGSNYRAASEKVKSNVNSDRDEEDLSRTGTCRVEMGSDSGDQVLHCSSSGNPDSHSGEPNMENDTRPIKKASVEDLQSIESEYYLSYDSISAATGSDEQEDSKDESYEHDLSSGEHKHSSRTRLKSVAESNVAKHEQTPSVVHRKLQKDLEWDITCNTRKRKTCYDTDDSRGHLYSYRESEVSLSYRSRIQGAKHGREKSFKRDSRGVEFGSDHNRISNGRDCLEQKESYFSERYYEDRGRRSSVRKYSDQSLSKNKSLFEERYSCSYSAEERKGGHCVKVDPEYDNIIHDYREREHHEEDRHRRHTDLDFYDMEQEDFDIHRHGYPAERRVRSPGMCRYDIRSNFQDRSSNYIENGVDHRLVSRRYEESANTDERDWDTYSPREHLPISWRSKGRFMNCRDHPNIRDLQLKSKKYGCAVPSIKGHRHLSYEHGLDSDNVECISEGNVYHENIVSSVHKRRCNRLAKLNLRMDDRVRFRHCEQDDLPLPERFLLERSPNLDNFEVSKPFFRGQRLFRGRPFNNVRKLRVVEVSDSDPRGRVNFVQEMGRHELATVECEAVNNHLKGFKRKSARRSGGSTGESQKEIGSGYKDNLLKNPRHFKQACKQEKIHPDMSKGRNSHNQQTGLKVDKVRNSNSIHSDDHTKITLDKSSVSQNFEDAEIEEGELIEEPEKKDVVSVTKDWISGKKVNKIQSNYSSQNGKVSVKLDNNRILETLAKMEKRMERFKEPIVPRQGPEKTVNPQVDVPVVSDEVKQQRPARKRRWGGN